MSEAERTDPYTLVFRHALFEEQLFPGIHDEAVERGVRTSHPETFVRLQSVGDVLDRLVPPDPAAAAGGMTTAAASEIAEHARLLYHAYHFWCYGGSLHALDGAAARVLLTALDVQSESALRPPSPSGYVRLPTNLVWARIDSDLPAEPVDGFFWTMAGAERADSPPFDRLDVLLALGVRPGRAGFSIIAAGEACDAEDTVAHWESGPARADGEDFENILPGGEIGGLFAITTPAEALKLASRWFRRRNG
jgi:hypothetical protein